MKLTFSFLASLSLANALVSYDGWKVVRVDTRNDVGLVRSRLASINYDEWSQEDSYLDIAIPGNQILTFGTLGLDSYVLHEDLGRSIAAESAPRQLWKRQADDLSWFDSYHSYEDHKAYFESLHETFPDNSEIVSTGTSYEGRDIWGIHFWGADGPGKPAVLWHGTVHAREWIAAPVIEYLTLQLIQGYGSNGNITKFVDDYDFWVFPFVNPDGFVYTQTTERLWRKNRQPNPSNATCVGRDLNRNWPHKWDANDQGASKDPCSNTYRGEKPNDAPEIQGLRKLVDKLGKTSGIKLYIDWHSYSQYLLAPVGYSCTKYVDNLGQHINLASRASKAIRAVEGVQYTFGPSCTVLYPSTGYSIDYVYEVAKADWAYLIELRDTGNYGFVLPPEQIIGTAKEQWAGIQVVLSLLDEVFFDGIGPA
ncbi:hypothetical protein FDECE_8471 [Fusarium decemcellulare]|nr:hypothetical protein FDECE_8471 [Fusarium decemcellulare]